MKVLTVVGTRPEIIRLSRVVARLDVTPGVEHVLAHTGQNYDHQLNQVFFDDLGMRLPDHYMNVDTSSLAQVMGDVLVGTEQLLLAERPDALLVLGDTNSCIAALIAKRMGVPTYHMEAGNRCFDANVPEETNRRMVDHVADFNLTYTEHAQRNLIAEGLHPRRIFVSGSPMSEVLEHSESLIDNSDVLARLGLTRKKYFLASTHRQENVDDPHRLNLVLDCLEAVEQQWGQPVIVSTHPRTRKRLETLGRKMPSAIMFLEPLGFHDYNKLQKNALGVLSDSGTLAEESSILGFPAISLRETTERPEALETGSIMTLGLDPSVVTAGLTVALESTGGPRPEAYQIADVSRRVVNFILSTVWHTHQWDGIRLR